MSTNSFSFTLGMMVAGLLVLAACTPAAGSDVVSINKNGGTAVTTAGPGIPSNQPGSSEPGTGVGETVTTPESTQPPTGKRLVSTDTNYKFSVSYPDNFVVRSLPAEKFVGLNPVPVAAIFFMNPTAASSQVPDEPGDLEVRIYSPAGVPALDGWLKSAGLTSGATSQAFKTAYVSGIEVCGSTMVFPRCRDYVFGNGWVYQLTSTSVEGEAMLQTFQLVP